MNTRVVKPERETQKHAIELVLDALPSYAYLGNLEDVENSNIRENELREFLTSKQHCTASEATEAINALKQAAACGSYSALYEKGLDCYKLLRNGANISRGYGETYRHVDYIDFANPSNNRFAIAEEVTVRCVTEDLQHRRPDIVVYVNGIALVVLELKKVSVSVADAIRQNRRNQEDGEICQFFTTVQLIMAGNESEGIKYGVTKTPEEYWVRWKEPAGEPCEPSRFTVDNYHNEMYRSLLQMLEPARLLGFIHDCIIYDGGTKKAARPNQYFALEAAKRRVEAKESGIIWHSQGSGKSLTMIWLAQWIREQGNDSRIVIITDRDELDKQIENGFRATGETPYRATSGDKLIKALNRSEHSIICTLIHKFGAGLHDEVNADRVSVGDKKASRSPEECMEMIARSLPADFKPKGNIIVFIDECHRTQGGILHKAMRQIMGKDVMMIGFTGTPLLKTKKITSLEQFGSFIHTYKFDEAVRDEVILDLRYEARNVEQTIEEDDKEEIDRIFNAKTINMTERAKEALRKKWATLQNIYSSDARVRKIVRNICKDMTLYPALSEGYGNAMLVAGDVYQAYKYWEAFERTDLKGKTTVVTSYDPAMGVSIQEGHSTDADNDQETFKCNMAKRMMGERSAIDHEDWAKEQFVENPGSMKLIIVVDKLLTGFDAPKATYLYIDKHMENHNLFQAICRVNRKDIALKKYGYIIDYKDLFNEIKDAVEDYTNGAFASFEKEDVEGLLKNRLEQGKKDLEDAFETLEGFCQNVKHPKGVDDYFDFFVYPYDTPVEEQQAVSLENANKREKFYDAVMTLVNLYLGIATQMTEAGYTEQEAKDIHKRVSDYDDLRKAIMLRSGDATDLKQYNAMMRQLLDQYVQAPRASVLEKLEDFSFLDFIDSASSEEVGLDEIIDGEKEIGHQGSAAEAISGIGRKYIVRKRDSNPVYYDSLSDQLNKLLERLKERTAEYKEVLRNIIALIRELRGNNHVYPAGIDTDGLKALFDNLGQNAELALRVYKAVCEHAEPGFRNNRIRQKALRLAISETEGVSEDKVDVILNLVINNQEF